jgi:hypothetical protein
MNNQIKPKKVLFQLILDKLTSLCETESDSFVNKEKKTLVYSKLINKDEGQTTITISFAVPFYDAVTVRAVSSEYPDAVQLACERIDPSDTVKLDRLIDSIKTITEPVTATPSEPVFAIKKITHSQEIRKRELTDISIRCDDDEPVIISVPTEIADKFKQGNKVIAYAGGLQYFDSKESFH